MGGNVSKIQQQLNIIQKRMLLSNRDPKEVEMCMKDMIKNYPPHISQHLRVPK